MDKEAIKQFCELYQTDLILARVQLPVMIEAFLYYSFGEDKLLKDLLKMYQIDMKEKI